MDEIGYLLEHRVAPKAKLGEGLAVQPTCSDLLIQGQRAQLLKLLASSCWRIRGVLKLRGVQSVQEQRDKRQAHQAGHQACSRAGSKTS